MGFRKTNNIKTAFRNIYCGQMYLIQLMKITIQPSILRHLYCGTPVVCYKTGGAFEMFKPKIVVLLLKKEI